LRSYIYFSSKGIRASYNQVFFSDNGWFALALFVASFTDVSVGISGLTAVVMALGLGKIAGLHPGLLSNGTYTYNVLLVGLTMGAYFRLDAVFFVILLLASLITLLLSVWMSAAFARKQLPMLSLPFVLGVWIILLAARHFPALGLNERGIYLYNELWNIGGARFLGFYLEFEDLGFPSLLVSYLKSMGAIFFQNHVLSGLLITIGLLAFSRIAFSLSIIGFLSGYFFSTLMHGNLTDIEYSYIGFNYILTAMAIGGFFLVPSIGSYILAALSAPLISLFVGALSSIVSGYMLSLYSLPFTLVVLLLIYAVYSRPGMHGLYPVRYQLYSPEKNLYLHRHYTKRFRSETVVPVHLPFYGEWTVSQGYSGNPTHQGDWQYALDFVVTAEDDKTYRLPGEQLNDYYCYQLPVLAPADGIVAAVEDGVNDNPIGQANLRENWGNTIVIKHAEQLYSKLSHLKPDSFKVKPGDVVKKGELLALCGSSGRSPEPHLHFQIQALPLVGAKTLSYPISSYLSRKSGVWRFHTFEVPVQGERISRPIVTPLLSDAFLLLPGRKLEYLVNRGKGTERESWEVFAGGDGLNYLYCAGTGSSAWFRNDGTLFWFTSFTGDTGSLLYYFYLAAQKILLSFQEGLVIQESLPATTAYRGAWRWLQDLVAPFYVFLDTRCETTYLEADQIGTPSAVRIRSRITAYVSTRASDCTEVEMVFAKGTLDQLIVKKKDICFTASYIG